jgi:hypothetical protein
MDWCFFFLLAGVVIGMPIGGFLVWLNTSWHGS